MAFNMSSEQLAYVLQGIGYYAVQIWPFVPSEIHLLLSAALTIYAGAHASLTRPHSAAKPPRGRKELLDDTNDDDEHESKMETLEPMDAVYLPVLAGTSLGGLYLLIKWLDDPTLLSKVLNWYLALFGTLTMAKLGADAMNLVHGFVFPDLYVWRGRIWEAKSERRLMESSQGEEVKTHSSPLPGPFSLIRLPNTILHHLWSLRSVNERKFHVRAYIYDLLTASVKLNHYDLASAIFAIAFTLWRTLISAPWYLNNISAFAFVYSALQFMSPNTSSTATLILSALFGYDIYFVFYTPLMVTVAKHLDIPAKMLFPRPGGMSMLGLGDLVVPGIVIGFALRFDLWRYYTQMPQRNVPNEADPIKEDEESSEVAESDSQASSRMEKPIYRPAAGHWGTRFWTGSSWKGDNQASRLVEGGRFPKPYFHATLVGYVLGMVCTLLVMQVFQHAQPALLYLVPGVLGALWGTALVKGEIGMLWAYSEDSESEDRKERRTAESGGTDQPDPNSTWRSWFWSQLYLPPQAERPSQNGAQANGSANTTEPDKTPEPPKHVPEPSWAAGYLIYFSVSLPRSTNSPSQTELVTEPSQDRGSVESDK